MPNYDFKCPGCDKQFEKVVPSSVTLEKCPDCGQYAERQPAAPVGRVRGGTPRFYK